MKPAIIALLLLSSPAMAANVTEVAKTPACQAGAPVQIIRQEPDVIVINYLMAQAQTKIWLREQRAKRPCQLPRRVRSVVDGRCYLKKFLPEGQ